MRIVLSRASRSFGASLVLSDVTLSVPTEARIGIVGPNGVGKSTLLRLLSGVEEPDGGTVTREPATIRVGYLPQEPDAREGESLLGLFSRRTGVAEAELDLESAATALAHDPRAAVAYEAALDRLVALGGGDLEARARALAAEIGLGVELERPAAELSGGELARASLASILLSRHDILALDEPTNDLDFDGLARLESFLDGFPGGLVVVSHDRAFLDHCVDRVVAIDPITRTAREYAGGWTAYAQRRSAEHATAWARFERADERQRHLTGLLSERQTQARAGGAMASRRGTKALTSKVSQVKRLMKNVDDAPKPVEPWELRLSLAESRRTGDVVVELDRAVAAVGHFTLGPVDLRLIRGERLSIVGANGSGKSTLLRMLIGTQGLVSGRRRVGPQTDIGMIGQGRDEYDGPRQLIDVFRDGTGLEGEPARTLLAKFGLAEAHIERACATLSPGERTRAYLAALQARGVNLIVLDEPSNHLDLDAIEQLEQALGSYAGTVVVVSHDRRFLDEFAPTRQITMPWGWKS
jgi:ATPase subunit of ABC transporter with duplicated ATPase domains